MFGQPPPPYSAIPSLMNGILPSYITPLPGSSHPPRPPGLRAPPPPKSNPPPRPPKFNPPPQPSGYNPPPQPSVPNYSPIHRSPRGQAQGGISCGLVICIAVVLFQTLLMLNGFDPLKPLIDIESATRRVSMANSTLTVERGKTEHEREAMVHEKELWEQAKEARVPHGAFWEVVWPDWDCHAYGKREYWGVLRNIPEGWSETDACMNMPVVIKGVTVRRPYRCAYEWGSPHIRGYWMVDWDQPDCKPWYRDYHDGVCPKYPPFRSPVCTHTPSLAQGCTGYGSGRRRIEAHIVGINGRQVDWRVLCNTTPLVWNSITYTSPARCEQRVSGFPFRNVYG